MAGNPVKNLVIVGSVFLALLLGVSAWFSWREGEKRRRAFALHEHEKREPVQQPCLVLKQGVRTTPRATIQDCLLLGPEGANLDVLEVNLRTGLLVLAKTDTFLPGEIPIALTRIYRPGDWTVRGFGISSDHPYNIGPGGDTWPYTYSDLVFYDGNRIHHDRISRGVAYHDAVFEHLGSRSPYDQSRIRWTGNGWDLTRMDGWQYLFPPGRPGVPMSGMYALRGLRNPRGKLLSFARNASGDLKRIESPNGNWINLEYEDRRIVRTTDSLGRSVGYSYDAWRRLIKIQEAKDATELSYDSSYLLTMRKNKALAFRCEYDGDGRVANLTLADGSVYHFRYRSNGEGYVETHVTVPSGEVVRVSSDRKGYAVGAWESQAEEVQAPQR